MQTPIPRATKHSALLDRLPDIDALVLECTGLSCFSPRMVAARVQHVGVPAFRP
ncbi:hypothetical protein [Marinobacterium rhizophilum]|uniref:Uncharacterized protein n=1 Tax=Marinobacterium rhizophilum TaxID=420402 RepID=A0ABY5HDU4_9GAMM|nr:hypothetical protein [Marinobacterium rhizophilum]UTW10516.1 hypothetical protein KDW95_14580 [Marinobacterium rhizophilum]